MFEYNDEYDQYSPFFDFIDSQVPATESATPLGVPEDCLFANVCQTGEARRVKYPATSFATTMAPATTTTEVFDP